MYVGEKMKSNISKSNIKSINEINIADNGPTILAKFTLYENVLIIKTSFKRIFNGL